MGQDLKKARIWMFGCSNSGKQQFCININLISLHQQLTTFSFNLATFDYKTIEITMCDCYSLDKKDGLSLGMSTLDGDSPPEGLIWVVDAADESKLTISQEAFENLLNRYKQLDPIPVCVFANKKDLPKAHNAAYLVDKLELKLFLKNRPWTLIECSALKGEGLTEGLDWLLTILRDPKKATTGSPPTSPTPTARTIKSNFPAVSSGSSTSSTSGSMTTTTMPTSPSTTSSSSRHSPTRAALSTPSAPSSSSTTASIHTRATPIKTNSVPDMPSSSSFSSYFALNSTTDRKTPSSRTPSPQPGPSVQPTQLAQPKQPSFPRSASPPVNSTSSPTKPTVGNSVSSGSGFSSSPTWSNSSQPKPSTVKLEQTTTPVKKKAPFIPITDA